MSSPSKHKHAGKSSSPKGNRKSPTQSTYRIASELGSIETVKEGYPVAAFNSLATHLHISREKLGKVTGISWTTLNRRQGAGKLKVRESERIYLIQSIFDQAIEVFESEEAAHTWLQTPLPALNNQTPLQTCETLPGADQVRNLLMAIEYGVYV
jgi:putative toxin-antitoxin system antitoxin component (TIGR02293 family)